jgi:hypothetical protein
MNNRLTQENEVDDKKTITFTIHKDLKARLRETLISSEKYNQRRKSDWVNEAIDMFTEVPDYTDIVMYADESNSDFVFDKIYMTFNQRCNFSHIRAEVVRSQPNIRGPQAAIIRSAILIRLQSGL